MISGRLRSYGTAKVQISWQLCSPAELAVAFIEPPTPYATRPQNVARDYEASEGVRRGNTRSKFGHLAS